MKNTTTFELEYTDTFCGEANYGWVKRFEIQLPENVSDSVLIKNAKKELGITLRHKPKDKSGDMITLDFYNSHTRLFIMVKDI